MFVSSCLDKIFSHRETMLVFVLFLHQIKALFAMGRVYGHMQR